MTKFKDMIYKRPDMDALLGAYAALCREAESASSPEQLVNAIDRHETLYASFQTQSCLSYIRHTIDTRDAFYEAEKDFFDEHTPEFEEAVNAFYDVLLTSPHRAGAESLCGKIFFDTVEVSRKCFSPEIVPLLKEENALLSRYQKLIASARIPFDGQILNVSKLTSYKLSPDREVRKAALYAEGEFYLSVGEEIDEIYDQMVRVRTEIAHKLGYRSFTEVGYLRMKRTSYSREDVEAFRAAVRKHIVPAVCELKKKQSEKNGIADMKMHDDLIIFPEGNAKPQGSASDILAAGREMYHRMSEETAEFVDFLYDSELLDVEAKDGKAVGGYCEMLADYKASFIFSNFNGTSGDVDVLTHEAGHAFADYMVRDLPYREIMNPTLEGCETHSMSMEFFAWRYLDLFYGEETDKAKYCHLAESFSFIPYGCIVDEFQHIMYDRPELTKAQRHEVWEQLERTYRPYLDRTGVPFFGDGRGWQRQLHIFLHPFYYIDYCLAQTESLVFWAESQEDYEAAFDKYMRFVNKGGTLPFRELCECASIPDPFGEDALVRIAGSVSDWFAKR
ncbi:MAG: M3 family oligoendopeptidase [Ruminococcaceae bacterium]|nr:M3 family oligoendopeptidase [Oscillospiraceae bacterium]